jgi:hypothetical protein
MLFRREISHPAPSHLRHLPAGQSTSRTLALPKVGHRSTGAGSLGCTGRVSDGADEGISEGVSDGAADGSPARSLAGNRRSALTAPSQAHQLHPDADQDGMEPGLLRRGT